MEDRIGALWSGESELAAFTDSDFGLGRQLGLDSCSWPPPLMGLLQADPFPAEEASAVHAGTPSLLKLGAPVCVCVCACLRVGYVSGVWRGAEQ